MMRYRRQAATQHPITQHPITSRLIKSAGVGALLGSALLAGAAAATEVKYPTSDPRIILQVPDNWAVSSDANGLALTSPEKDAYVLAGIVARNEKAVEVWAKEARAKLVAAGTQFDKSKPTRTLVAKARPNQPPAAPNSFSGAPSLGFAGAPAVSPSFGSAASTSVPAASTALEAFKVIQMAGSTLNGKPVDVEISFYKVGTEDLLVLEQESGPVDERGVAIEKTLKVLK